MFCFTDRWTDVKRSPVFKFKCAFLDFLNRSFLERAQCVSVVNLVHVTGFKKRFDLLVILDDLLNGIAVGEDRGDEKQTEYGGHQVSHDLKYSPLRGTE